MKLWALGKRSSEVGEVKEATPHILICWRQKWLESLSGLHLMDLKRTSSLRILKDGRDLKSNTNSHSEQ